MSNSSEDWIIEALNSSHNREEFSCGNDFLDRYFKNQIGQETRKYTTSAFVLIETTSKKIAGYYTLSSTEIEPQNLPIEFTKRLPRYHRLPATLLGRLAIDRSFQGRGLGKVILINALSRAFQNTREIGSIALVVEAIDDQAAQYYKHFGFQSFMSKDHLLFLPMQTIKEIIGN